MDRKNKLQFGDFQTPTSLSHKICRFLSENQFNPSSILEPTCGMGNFLISAIDQFDSTKEAIGIDINPTYIKTVKERIESSKFSIKTNICQDDFFKIDWKKVLSQLPQPILIIGNPPWVTNSQLSSLGSSNLPKKSNFHHSKGIEALTGKSNFDISEWMLVHLIQNSIGLNVKIAMLCKTAVARKVLIYAWKNNIPVNNSAIYKIDAQKYFDAAVDACLFTCEIGIQKGVNHCRIHTKIDRNSYKTKFGFANDTLIANIENYERWKHLQGKSHYRWRSGLKHDCSKIMILEKENNFYVNGLGEKFELEKNYIFPLFKSSDISQPQLPEPSKYVLVTQKQVGEETKYIKYNAPKTWAYLQKFGEYLDKRKSRIYKNQPRFSIFGIGEYSFAKWKVAISGLYKKLHFSIVKPYENKPVMLDDTCYFIPCQSYEEAQFVAEILNSTVAKEFFEAFIFWDNKRPITSSILKKLDISKLAKELSQNPKIESSIDEFNLPKQKQLNMFARP